MCISKHDSSKVENEVLLIIHHLQTNIYLQVCSFVIMSFTLSTQVAVHTADQAQDGTKSNFQ